MSKPLLGGSAAAAALLSAWLLFYAQPSVAETLAVASQELQQKTAAPETKAPGADATTEVAEAGDAFKESETLNTAGRVSTTPAFDKAEEEAGETPTPALSFTATAYSLRGRTASGAPVSRGVIAADRRVLPIGTRVRLEAGSYSGEYVVADTGGAVRGRKIDIWVPSAVEAVRFGRRAIKLTVLTRTRPRASNPQAHR
jgi:3D (Asp-Asp-Asp) domain-containing protein